MIEIIMESMLDLWRHCMELAERPTMIPYKQRIRCILWFWEMQRCSEAILMRTCDTQCLVHCHMRLIHTLIHIEELQRLLRDWLIRRENVDMIIIFDLAPEHRQLRLHIDLLILNLVIHKVLSGLP